MNIQGAGGERQEEDRYSEIQTVKVSEKHDYNK